MEITTAGAREPGSGDVREALGSALATMKLLAEVDMAQLSGECVAETLIAMEHIDAAQAAIRGKAVTVFNDKKLHHEYGHRATTAWLIHHTRVRGGKASQVSGLGSLRHHHPVLAAALAEIDVVSESIAIQIGKWTNTFPDECIDRADEILIDACRAGASEALLADIAAQIRVRVCGPDPEEEKGKLEERTLRLERTLDGAGRLDGNLTPECAALLQSVLEVFGRKDGTGDNRGPHERNHDALERVCKLILAGKKGKSFKAVVHIAFEDLLAMRGASAMIQSYTEQVTAMMAARAADARARWAGHRAAEAVTGGGDGGTWLTGDHVLAVLPDAMIIPVVTTAVAAEHMEQIIEIGAELHRLAAEEDAAAEAAADAAAAEAAASAAGTAAADLSSAAARQAREARMDVLRRKLVGEAIALVSGPDAVVSWLRQGLLGTPGTGPLGTALAGRSLPLDVGYSKKIPDQIRLAAGIRSPHCQAYGCRQPTWVCEAHHLEHREDGGETRLANIEYLCWWHHHILIHRMGWSAALNGDGTLTFRKPDGTILPNGPPIRPG